jgi:rhodanese-related sulfurtransferase
MKTELTIHDPAEAKRYFEQKLAFTTGPIELDRMLKEGALVNVVDVRAAEDFAKGHIPGAVNLPKERWDSLEGLQREKVNVLCCYTQVCHLAATAAVRFADKGYPVMELEGGFETWKDYDMEVEGDTINRLKKTTNRLLHRR